MIFSHCATLIRPSNNALVQVYGQLVECTWHKTEISLWWYWWGYCTHIRGLNGILRQFTEPGTRPHEQLFKPQILAVTFQSSLWSIQYTSAVSFLGAADLYQLVRERSLIMTWGGRWFSRRNTLKKKWPPYGNTPKINDPPYGNTLKKSDPPPGCQTSCV